jgi:hypothetical protein
VIRFYLVTVSPSCVHGIAPRPSIQETIDEYGGWVTEMILRKRPLFSAGAAVAFAASLSIVSGASAYATDNGAASPVVNCSSGEVCVWGHSNYQGTRWTQTPGNKDNQCYTTPFIGESISNRTPRTVKLYEGESCNGRLMGTAHVNGENGGVGYIPAVTFRSFTV